MTTLTQTSTYSGRFTWTIHDEVIRLRQWATDTVYELPKVSEDRSSECTVGAGRGCQIQLDDRWASRHHALLSYEEGFWNVADLDSRNGVKIDGVRLRKARLEPGMEVRIGRTTLVAESLRSIGLRCYLGRILGWSERQRETVDAAMGRVRQAHRERAPIVLRGEEEYVFTNPEGAIANLEFLATRMRRQAIAGRLIVEVFDKHGTRRTAATAAEALHLLGSLKGMKP